MKNHSTKPQFPKALAQGRTQNTPMPRLSPPSRALSRVLIAMTLVMPPLTGCSGEPFYWYEEAQQDDGSIIIVKTSETRTSQTGLAPGASTAGYRLIQAEFDNPKTGQHIKWKPTGIPPLQPLALHIENGSPYFFGLPFTYALGAYGCPIPPYVIFKWTGRIWTRVSPADVPRKFSRVNLLSSSSERFLQGNEFVYVQHKMLVRAASLDRSKRKPIDYIERYKFRLQYENVGPLEGDCGQVQPFSTKFDHLELTNGID